MMSRTQVVLAPELQRKARSRAHELGCSFAEYIRRLVARDLDRPVRRVDPSAVFDLGRSQGANVARDKDRMLADAVATRTVRRK